MVALSDFEEIFDNIDSPRWSSFRITVFAFTMLIQIFGSGLCFGIWSFERYGGDPQKRTILNRLLGQVALNTILTNVLGLSSFMARLIVGPLSPAMVEAMFFVINTAFGSATLMALDQMAFIRLFTLSFWKHMPPIDDDFFGRYLWLLNVILGFLTAIGGRLGSSGAKNMYFLLTGSPDLTDSGLPNFKFFTVVLFATMIIHGCFGVAMTVDKLKLWKKKRHSIGPLQLPENANDNLNLRFNTKMENLNLVNIVFNAGSLVFVLVFYLSIASQWTTEFVQPTVYGYVLPHFALTVAMPLKFTMNHPEIWRHVKSNYFLR